MSKLSYLFVGVMIYFSFGLIYLYSFAIHWQYWIYDLDGINNNFTFPLSLDMTKPNSFLPSLFNLINGIYEIKLGTGINDNGIAFLYYLIIKLFDLKVDKESIVFLSFGINSISLCVGYVYLQKVSFKSFGRNFNPLLFFLNPTLIYYSQLMNKEALTLMFISIILFYYIERKYWGASVIILLLSVIRLHFVCFFALIALQYFKLSRLQILIFFYIFLGLLVTNLIFRQQDYLFIDNQIGFGFTKFVYELNRDFGIGNFYLFPFEVLQIFYDQVISIFSIFSGDKIVVYNLKEIPVSILLILSARRIFYVILGFFERLEKPTGDFFLFIISFLLIISLSPISHFRYLFPIIYPFFFYLYYSDSLLIKNNVKILS